MNGHRCNHPYPYYYSAVCNLLSCYYINVMSIRVCELKLRALDCYMLAVRCWFLNSVNIILRRLLFVSEDTSISGVPVMKYGFLFVLEDTSISGVPVMKHGYQKLIRLLALTQVCLSSLTLQWLIASPCLLRFGIWYDQSSAHSLHRGTLTSNFSISRSSYQNLHQNDRLQKIGGV